MYSDINRRTLIRGAIGGAATAVLGVPAFAQNAPFRIGLLTIKTGSHRVASKRNRA